jgi:hypothetical protein
MIDEVIDVRFGSIRDLIVPAASPAMSAEAEINSEHL